MFFPLMNLVYLVILVSTILIAFSSNSWVSCWMMMEINLMAFIPLLSEKDFFMDSPQSLKYFLVQVMGSLFIFFFILLESSSSMYMSLTSYSSPVMGLALLVKSGIPPLHFWFPQLMQLVPPMQGMILLTLQKFIPLLLIYLSCSELVLPVIIISGLVGCMGGFNQNSLMKIMAYSSMVHSSWLLASMKSSFSVFMNYLLVYSLIVSSMMLLIKEMEINNISDVILFPLEKSSLVCFIMNLFSLAGLPPLLGFLNKLMVIYYLNHLSFVILILMACSLISLVFYTRLIWYTLCQSFYSKKEKFSQMSSNTGILNWLAICLNSAFPVVFVFLT